MDANKEEIKYVLKLDAIAAFFKLMSIAFIPVILINAVVQMPLWYLTIFIDVICVCMYLWRLRYIKKQFTSYEVLYARIERMNRTLVQGTRRITYSYEYESVQYTANSVIADFLRNSYSAREGNLMKIIVNTNNPKETKILKLLS